MWRQSATGRDRSGRWRGWLIRFGLGVTGAALGVGLLYALENWESERVWQRYKSSLMAQGQRFDLAAFFPPPVPEDENFLKAPIVKEWFVAPPGALPTTCALRIARSGDERLLGSWGECRPTDLTEWRECFRRVPLRAPSATNDQPADAISPLIEIDDLPLFKAILNLARQANCNFQFDTALIDPAQGGGPLGQSRISVRFENVTPREALECVLANHGLALMKTPYPGLLRVTKAVSPAAVWPDEGLELDSAPLPPGVEERVPLIVISEVPVLDAVRNVARQARLNLQFDPELDPPAVSSSYSLRLTNVTLREALARVLNDNDLALKASGDGSIYRVVRASVPGRSAQERRYYTAAAVLASFASFDQELGALYAACERRQSRVDVDFPRAFGSGGLGPWISAYRQIAEALVLHASAQLALSNAPAAMQDATALFRLAESLRGQPGLVAAMLQGALTDYYLQVLWEGLAGRRWSMGELKTLGSQLQSIDLLVACRRGLEAEQALYNQWLEQTPRAELAEQYVERSSALEPENQSQSTWALPLAWSIRGCPRGWIRQAQIGCTEAFQDHLAMLNAPQQRIFPTRHAASSSRARPPAAWVRPVAAWFHRHALNQVQPGRASARLQTGVNLARIACALERHRQACGRFPDRTDELQPGSADCLPHDLVTGLPLQYAPTDDGQFVLYSVGWDGADDRGSADDWVWRYPAR